MKCAMLVAAVLLCHAADRPLQFEVASVKPSPPRAPGAPRGMFGCSGGPGTRDPIRFRCMNSSVPLMLRFAYELEAYQIRPPFSEDDPTFNVEAKVPPGATPAEAKVMLRNLLSERFKIASHRESVEVKGFALILAKGGLKMKDAAPAGDTPATDAPGPVKNADGFSYLFPARNALRMATANGLTRWVGLNIPVDAGATEVRLTGLLTSITGQPVIDATGLKGKYDFMLTFGSDPNSASLREEGGIAPDTVFQALEKQLGLKLESRKIMVDTFVIDHAEKTPVEN